MSNDRLSHTNRFAKVDMLVQRCVFAITQLDDTGYLDKVNASSEIKGAGYCRT